MNQDKKQNILNWFAKADEDLYATEILFKHDPNFVLNVIGFHCQQSVEKYLKAFLISLCHLLYVAAHFSNSGIPELSAF